MPNSAATAASTSDAPRCRNASCITLENPAFHLVVVSVYRADEGVDTRVRLAQVATVLTAPTSPAP